MKTFKSTIITFLTLLIMQSFTTMSARTEEQKYTIVHTEKEFVIRFYPSAILATIYYEARSYRDLAYLGFRKLAGYIFGSNESETKISMTSPVHMEFGDNRSSMSFVMPSSFSEDNLPQPDDPSVKLEKTEDIYAAVISFGGYASDKKINEYSRKLKAMLDEKGIVYYGNFRYLGYNPPYQILGRRNEIIVPVRWKEKKPE